MVSGALLLVCVGGCWIEPEGLRCGENRNAGAVKFAEEEGSFDRGLRQEQTFAQDKRWLLIKDG